MKNYILPLFAIVLISLLISCKSSNYFKSLSNQQQIDTRLVGDWEGSEVGNQIDGVTKEWKMIRTDQGKFTLHFKVSMHGKTREFTEEGNWWIENGVFHEFHNDSGKTDKYNYEVLDKNQIKFKAISLGMDFENEAYEFIDHRVDK